AATGAGSGAGRTSSNGSSGSCRDLTLPILTVSTPLRAGMAGHSHSANIAVRKGKQDAQRARLFSKLSRYIIIAARAGGGDPDTNLKLRYAIDKARAVSMPRDN